MIYRREDVVEELAPHNGKSLSLISMFPKMYTPELSAVGSPDQLLHHLRRGALKASGRSTGEQLPRQDIRSEDWLQLRFLGDRVWRVSDDGKQTVEPWCDLVLEAAEVRKMFRGASEVQARTGYNWGVLREIHDDLRRRHPEMTQNELIVEIQGQFEDRFNRKPPGRSTIQRHMQKWT